MIVSLTSLLRMPSRRDTPRHRHVLVSGLFAVACMGCGAAPAPASDPGSTMPARTSQAALAQDAWQALLTADSALNTLATAQAQPWQTAGTIVATDGTTLVWAEFAPAADAPRAQVAVVFRSCAKPDGDAAAVCVRGKGNYTATGVALTDDAGKAVDLVLVGAPEAWEWETSTNLDNDNSTIVAGLSGDAPPLDVNAVLAQFSAITAQKRRFVLLSAYGKQVGVDASAIVAAAQKSGRFDSVETIEFVRRTDIEALLPTLTALDTVVWLGAGVQQKPSKSSPPTKAIGMNVTRGVFGDEVYYGKIAAPLLETPPLGGPGLLVLAGQNTYLGDVGDKQSLAAVWYEPATRPVVGFSLPLGVPGASGYPRIALTDVIAATARLVGALGDGKDLETAMVNAASGQAFALTSPMASDNRKKWTWTAANGSFWAKPPTTGSLTIQMNLTPNCKKPVDTCDLAGWTAGVKASGMINGPIKLVCANPTFVGPYFSCQGGYSQPPGTAFSVTGVMRGTAADDHLLFLAQAADGGPLGSALILGDGVLTKDGIDIGGGTTTYPFSGQAVLSTYIDGSGNCCITYPPQLTGTSASDFSALQIHN